MKDSLLFLLVEPEGTVLLPKPESLSPEDNVEASMLSNAGLGGALAVGAALPTGKEPGS